MVNSIQAANRVTVKKFVISEKIHNPKDLESPNGCPIMEAEGSTMLHTSPAHEIITRLLPNVGAVMLC